MTERVRALRARGVALVLGVREVLELDHARGVVLLAEQLLARLEPGPVLAAVRVAHVRDAVGRAQLRREQVPHPQHLPVKLLARRQVRHRQREMIDAEAEGLRIRRPVVAHCQEFCPCGAPAVLSRVEGAPVCDAVDA